MNRLTVIITCKDERENIRACVESAQQVADEVLVADSGSTDGTREIALRLGCRIIDRHYRTAGDFKNWAIPQAANQWVLILDADERITPQLASEIRGVLADPRHEGYWIYRRNYFLGHPIRFGPWKNDRCLRLFLRDLGRYAGPSDHAEVVIGRGTAGRTRIEDHFRFERRVSARVQNLACVQTGDDGHWSLRYCERAATASVRLPIAPAQSVHHDDGRHSLPGKLAGRSER